MSEPNIGGGCHECGGQYEHKEFCSKNTPPPVYDLAEFERQLAIRIAISKKAHLERELICSMQFVLDALIASKREAQ